MDRLRRLLGHVKGTEPDITRLVEESDMRDVRATFYVALPFIAVAELINAVLLLTALGGLSTTARRVYFALYVSLFAASVACLLYLLLHRRDDERPRRILNAHLLYVLFLCLWGTFLTIYDQRASENVSVYVTLVMAASVIARMTPLQTVCVLGASQALLLAFFRTFQPEPVNNLGNYMNTSFMCLTAILISCSRYASKVDEIRSLQVMTRQKEEIERINARLRYLVDTDELTGLSNRRVLDAELPALFERCREQRRPFAVLMADIDDFKAFNDTYGHQVGDRCIHEVAEVLRRAAQEFEERLLVRYGGEEFAVFVSGVSRDRIAVLADDLCRRVRALCLQTEQGTCYDAVRMSIGWSWCIPGPDARVSDIISSADRALYRAKREGKDRAVAS